MRAFFVPAICFLTAIGWAGGRGLVHEAPASAAKGTNPFEGSERARIAGAKLYARECAACHGRNRQGRGKAPPLNRAEVYQAPPGTLFWVLRNGSLKRGMPSFAHLPDPQRWQIITFLRGYQPGTLGPVSPE
jgi:mono/diheme cytochrome c family protein